MAEQIVRTTDAVAQTPDGAVRQQTSATTAVASGATLAQRVIRYITGAVMALLALRFVLALLGANQGNGFADFVYTLSYPFVAPFFGLFGYQMQYGVARLEIETLVAMAVYALVGFGLAKLAGIRKA